jgi:hypothetical protein
MKITKEDLVKIIEEELKKMVIEEADDTINPIGKEGSSWWEKTGRMRPHYTSHGADYERYEPTYRMTPEHPDHPDHVPQPSRKTIDRRRCYRTAQKAVYGRRRDGSLDLNSGDPKNVETVFQTCLEFHASGKIKEYDALDRHFKDEPWYKDYRARSDEMQKVRPDLRQYATEGKTRITTSMLEKIVSEELEKVGLKKKFNLSEELPMRADTLEIPPGGVEVTDLEEKVKNFLSTKAYTKAGLDDAGRADFVRRHHKEFTQFVLDGEVYHIYGGMMANSEDQEVDPDNPMEVMQEIFGFGGKKDPIAKQKKKIDKSLSKFDKLDQKSKYKGWAEDELQDLENKEKEDKADAALKALKAKMGITTEELETIVREAFQDIDAEEQADAMLVGEVESMYNALMGDLDNIQDPQMKMDIIKMFQDALDYNPEEALEEQK